MKNTSNIFQTYKRTTAALSDSGLVWRTRVVAEAFDECSACVNHLGIWPTSIELLATVFP